MQWINKSVIKLMEQSGVNDPITYIKDKTRELVLMAFDKGWEGPPFDPIKFLKIQFKGQAEIIPNESVFDARLIPLKSSHFRIEYNPNQPKKRINFSVAHEIGHTFFPDYYEEIRNREEDLIPENKELEFLCNVAASEILLPYSVFSEEANSVSLDLNSLIELSKKFDASLESVFLRFCDVVDKPCAIVMASFSDSLKKLTVDYFRASRLLNINIKRSSLISVSSKAYECVNFGWTDSNIEKWSLLNNKKYQFYFIGLPPFKRTQNQRVGIFVVPLEYTEDESFKIKEIFGDATEPRGGGKKIIAQVINTTGGLGFGFGRSMGKKWPESKKIVNAWKNNKNDFVLGNTKLSELDSDIYVYQMIAQKGLFPKGDEPLIRYSVLRECLRKLAQEAKRLNASVHMPRIGAGQAKGDWDIIKGILHDELIQNNISVTVYILPGQEVKKKKKSSLTLFDDSTLYEK